VIVKLKAVLESVVVNLCSEPTQVDELVEIERYRKFFAGMQDLAGRFARCRAFAAGDDQTELSFTAFQAFFERAANGVVTPEECQSKPRTQPSDWNQ
jgi:hypothetical protein